MIHDIDFKFDPKFDSPTDDIIEKLLLSKAEADSCRTRIVRCPICGFKVAKIPVTQQEVFFVRCRKCKFEGALSPAYFRRKKHRRY